jgi:hypothetical protein
LVCEAVSLMLPPCLTHRRRQKRLQKEGAHVSVCLHVSTTARASSVNTAHDNRHSKDSGRDGLLTWVRHKGTRVDHHSRLGGRKRGDTNHTSLLSSWSNDDLGRVARLVPGEEHMRRVVDHKRILLEKWEARCVCVCVCVRGCEGIRTIDVSK